MISPSARLAAQPNLHGQLGSWGATLQLTAGPNCHCRLLAEHARDLFREGTDCWLFEKLGAHPMTVDGVETTRFAVWAPNAKRVSVIGDFNRWDRNAHPLQRTGPDGVWEGIVRGAQRGDHYKYHIVSRDGGHTMDKADPFAFLQEEPPKTASVIWGLDYRWGDQAWMTERKRRNALDAPISIYEVHLGSWMRVPEESNRWLTYREMAVKLAEYVQRTGFTHVEFLPVTEHPFYGSWGYQPTGFFAATRRYGTPQDFMYLVDRLHQHGIGVILDWVPFHFPNDGHALAYFDGTHLYAHPDPRRGYHPVWRSSTFDYGRPEVRSFLLSSASFWLEKYHLDGLRVDAVSYMLYLDYYRKPGEWIPNSQGGRDNLEAVAFLRRLNEEIRRRHPDVLTFAEEATVWPKVSRPAAEGGLGFDLKWDMGWMHDTLLYLSKPYHQRKWLLNKLTFRMLYAFAENFVLSLSHDEVVHLKRSLFHKMTGDPWQKFASLRLLFCYLYAQPGKKLLFMGGEFAQLQEWHHDRSLDWHLLDQPMHAGVQRCVTDLNRLYRSRPALHEIDCSSDGFEWIACDDSRNSVLTLLRKGRSPAARALIVCNFSPFAYHGYRVGAPCAGPWKEIFNSNAACYGGNGLGNFGGAHATPPGWNGRPFSLNLTLPPLAALYFEPQTGLTAPGSGGS